MCTREDYESKVKEYIEWYWPLKQQYKLRSEDDILSKVGIQAQKELENWQQELAEMGQSLKLTPKEAEVIYNGLVVARAVFS
jgi:hypothetical protein